MTEHEFNTAADAVFQRIEEALEHDNHDIDYDNNGVVMEIEFGNGSKIIVNRHQPNQEIWLAAKSGGFHYALHAGSWQSARDSSELFTQLTSLFAEQNVALQF
ncbi:MAG: iron donor protein CyaY [Sideroxydans sp.]|nr:iron donor protein CyaY [Sideroxydans sp.]NOT99617.1 iron donor protein CyaY [Sideroxydans sp.]